MVSRRFAGGFAIVLFELFVLFASFLASCFPEICQWFPGDLPVVLPDQICIKKNKLTHFNGQKLTKSIV